MPVPPARGFSPHLTLGILVSLGVLLPYATVALTFRASLMVQAASLLLLMVLALAQGLARGGPLIGPGMDRTLLLGLALYGTAAALGALVGLASGNSPELVAGQLLSMALLPLGAAAGSSQAPERTWPTFGATLPAAVAVATGIHLIAWLWSAARGDVAHRFILDNSVTVSGLALVALLLAVAGAGDSPSRRRLGVRLSLALVAVFVVGSGMRGLWLVAPPALLLALLLLGDPARRRRTLARVGVLAAVLLAAGWGIHGWLARPRPNLLPEGEELAVRSIFGEMGIDLPEGGRVVGAGPVRWGADAGPARPLPLPSIAIPGPATWRARFEVRAEEASLPQGEATVAVRWLDPIGRRLGGLGVRVEALPGWHFLEVVGTPPPGTTAACLEVGGQPGARGTFSLRGVRLERLGPAWAAPLLSQLAYLDRRLSSVGEIFRGEERATDSSLTVRLGESRKILQRFARAPTWKKLLGHGLGATFQLPAQIPSAARDAATGRQNYIHNFYLFLLFKLGILGSLLVVGALGSWLVFTLRCCLRQPGGAARRFLAAATATWVAYGVLALSSPEILNFRVAPFLGLLLAMTAGACRGKIDSSP